MKKFAEKLASFFGFTKAWVIGSGIIVTLAACLFSIFKPSYLNLMELKLYDVMLKKTHSGIQTTRVAIVDIDEASLEQFGQWPWPRYRTAKLFRNIQLAGAEAVGIDILFAEPDQTSPAVIQDTLKKDLGVDLKFSGLPAGFMDNDAVLAETLGQGNFVLGYSALFKSAWARKADRPGIKSAGNHGGQTALYAGMPVFNAVEIRAPGAGKAADFLFSASGLASPLPVLAEHVKGAGFMNTLADADGVLRRVPLLIACGQKVYPQLALATLMAGHEPQKEVPIIRVTRSGIESLEITNRTIPLESNGGMMINYRGPGRTYPYYSAKDVLNGQLEPGDFKGKIIFVGTSATGLKDIRVSPLSPVFPGVEVHATLVDNILSNDFIKRPYWISGLELTLVFIWGILTTFIIGYSNAILTLPITLVLGVAVWWLGLISMGRYHVWVSPFFPILVLILNFSILNLQKFRFSEKKKKFFREAFSKYVSSAVVDQLAKNPDRLSLQGEEKRNIGPFFRYSRIYLYFRKTVSVPSVFAAAGVFYAGDPDCHR